MGEIKEFKRFDSPIKIQRFLDSIPYNSSSGTKSPLNVLKMRNAHCFEGALFAAAALKNLGHKPLIVDMRAVNDDDHVIAVFKTDNRWGAVAKSNFTILRYREPVYMTIRELVMSYFDFYYNTKGEKTLREYSNPFNLDRFDKQGWITTNKDLTYIGDYLDCSKHQDIADKKIMKTLSKVDKKLFKAGLIGSKKSGLYKPGKKMIPKTKAI